MHVSRSYRTDLALEAADTGDGKLPDGVSVKETSNGGVKSTAVRIETPQASRRLGRPTGEYLTFEGDFDDPEPLTGQLAEALSRLLPDGPVLVVGLGNRAVTPDALGPDVASGVIATRHFPHEQFEKLGLGNLRPVCTVAPGVMGQTGIESADLIAALVKSIPFSAVVAVDALAARSATRLGRTIQLSDAGISPGAGVLNQRAELSKQTLGIPVFSLGIPTVIDAATLVGDLAPACAPGDEARNLMVTPRDIDRIISCGAQIVAEALNRALQPKLDADVITALMS